MIKKLSKLKQKYTTVSLLGLSCIYDIAHGAEWGGSADLGPIKTIAQFILKAGGWIGIVMFVVGTILAISLESGNSKNIIVGILYFVAVVSAMYWAVNYYNGKVNDMSNTIFQ